jgi:Mg2+-importing ATPase
MRNEVKVVTIQYSEQPFWEVSCDVLLKQLGTTQNGLSAEEATARRLQNPQSLAEHHGSSFRLLLKQFKSPITILLFFSAALTFLLAYFDVSSTGDVFSISDAPDGCIIVAILLASGLLSFWQEKSAADAVAKLASIIETRVTILRDNAQVKVAIKDIVPGDIVCLTAGEVVPGDCRLLSVQELLVNEAALTGESFPVEKSLLSLSSETPLEARSNSLFLGTHVVSGYGRAVVVKTGRSTELGKISAGLEQQAPATGFERGIQHFGQLLIKVVVLITIIVFSIKVGLQGRPLLDSLLVGLALAVGMTPQLLPAVTSVVLAAGAKAMSKQNVIVKQLLSIENLGSMTVLCSDKTGTLTEGTIRLHGALDANGMASKRVLNLAYLNAKLQTGFSNPIDRAICEAGVLGADSTDSQLIDELPYDFTRKRLSIRVQQPAQKLLICKGAFAQVLALCTNVELSDNGAVRRSDSLSISVRSMSQQVASDLQSRFQELSDHGMRVLALAVTTCETERISKSDERDMTFVGFLVFSDPPKGDARETISRLKELGITLKIVTGDNRIVAAAIGKQVGLESSNVITGDEIRTLNEKTLLQRVNEADIFAEVEPSQKESIIRSLQLSGSVVGYLGDGINDAPALHAADVGISVVGAADVASEAAQVVLLKHDLGVLVEGVIEGRRTFSNTLKYVFFAIAANFGYMLSLALSGLFLPFEPLLASQILMVNLLADFPAMALATDSVDPEQISRPRYWNTKLLVRFMLSFGLASSCFDFLMFASMYWSFRYLLNQDNILIHNPDAFEKLFQTGWFIESTLTGLVILLVIRTQRPVLQSMPGRLFIIAEICVAALTLVIPFSPLGTLLGFISPPYPLLLITAIVTILYGIGMEVVKYFFYRFMAEKS